MKKINNERGFSHVELLLAVLITAVIVFAGYYVYTQNKPDESSQANNTENSTQVDKSLPEDVFSIKTGETGSHQGNQIVVHKAHLEEAEYVTGSSTISDEYSSNKTQDDRIFLVVDFTVTNNSNNSKSYTSDDFTLEASDGKVLRSEPLTAKGKEWYSTELKTGGKVSAKIAFEVKDGQDNGATLIWQSPDWVTESENIKVSL